MASGIRSGLVKSANYSKGWDSEMTYKTAGFQQISSAAKSTGPNTSETLSIDDIIADREGYILAYLSNENQEAFTVHFDDFSVYHGKTNVVSTQDYYPFGLTFNESSRTASTVNSFKYNSFEFMDDLNLNLYDYQARYYDPAIGRFINVDPAADLMRRWSTYAYAYDNPIRYIDPDGMMPTETFDGEIAKEDQQQEQETKKKEDEPEALEATKKVIGKKVDELVEKLVTGASNFKKGLTEALEAGDAWMLSFGGDGDVKVNMEDGENVDDDGSENPWADGDAVAGEDEDTGNDGDQTFVTENGQELEQNDDTDQQTQFVKLDNLEKIKATNYPFYNPPYLAAGATTSGSSRLPAKPDSLQEVRSYVGQKLIKRDTFRIN